MPPELTMKTTQTHTQETSPLQQEQPVQEVANRFMPKFPTDEVDIEDLAKEVSKEVEDWKKLGQVIEKMQEEKRKEEQGNQEQSGKNINPFIENDVDLEDLLRMSEQLKEDNKNFNKVLAKEGFAVPLQQEQPVQENVQEEIQQANSNTSELERPKKGLYQQFLEDKAIKAQIQENYDQYKSNLKENLNKIKIDGDPDAFLEGALGILTSELNFDNSKQNEPKQKDPEETKIFQQLLEMKKFLAAYLDPKQKKKDLKSRELKWKQLYECSSQLRETCDTKNTLKYAHLVENICTTLDGEKNGKLDVAPTKSIQSSKYTGLVPVVSFKTKESVEIFSNIHTLIQQSFQLGQEGAEGNQKVDEYSMLSDWSEAVLIRIEGLGKAVGFLENPELEGDINHAQAKEMLVDVWSYLFTLQKRFNDLSPDVLEVLNDALKWIAKLSDHFDKDPQDYLYKQNNGLLLEETYHDKAIVKGWQRVLTPEGEEVLQFGNMEVDVIDCRHKTLFPTPPCLEDIQQNAIGDCYLLAGLAACLHTNPELPKEMMRDNGDTVTVRFFKSFTIDDIDLRPIYVTVHKNIVGKLSKVFWVQMIEKAYAVARMNNEFCLSKGNGNNDNSLPDPSGKVNYVNLNSGIATEAVMHLTGKVNKRKELATESSTLTHTLDKLLDAELLNDTIDENSETVTAKKRLAKLETMINNDQITAVNAEDVQKLMTVLSTSVQLHSKTFADGVRRVDPDALEDVRILLEEDKSVQYQGATEAERAKSKEYVILRVTEILFSSSHSKLTYSLNQEKAYSRGALDTFYTIKDKLSNNEPVVASGTRYLPTGSSEATREGLAETHAYSVIKCVEDGDRLFVVVHNPWGNQYGRSYELGKDNKLVKKATDSTDEVRKGLSFIELNDFMKSFSSIGI